MPKIIKAYQPLYTSKKRYKFLTGGRGSGKTFVVMDYEGRNLLQKNDRCLYTRYTMTSAEKSIIPEFKQRLEEIGISDICNITMDTVTNRLNGSFVFFSGLKPSSNTQKANLKSLPDINRLIVEEGEDFDDFERFNKIDDSIRTTKAHNEVLWLQNPSVADHFIFKNYFEKSYKTIKIDGFDVQICTHPDVEHIHTTYLDNLSNLDKSFLQKAYEWREKAKKGDPAAIRFYTNNYLGAWVDRPEGVVFTNWEEGDFDDSLQFIFGQDFGHHPDPSVLVKVAINHDKKLIHLHECYYQTDLITDQIKAYSEHYAHGHIIVADNNWKMTIFELRKKGVNMMPTTKYHGSIEDGVVKMQNYKIVVTPESHNIKMELKKYVYLDKGAKVFIDKYNHCFTGDTMVLTSNGLNRIDSLKIGDYALTSKGYRRINKVYNNGLKKVCEYKFLFSKFALTITGTSDHKIKTQKGWMQLQELTKNNLICLESNLMAKLTIYTLWRDIFLKAEKDFTGLCGSSIMEKFQKVFIFIIKMAILGIMTLLIWSLLTVKSISQNTALIMRKITSKHALKEWIMQECLHQNGTEAKKVKHGILSMQKWCFKNWSLSRGFANIAGRLTWQRKKTNFALTLVNQQAEETQKLTMKKEFASIVDMIFTLTNTAKLVIAQSHALENPKEIKSTQMDSQIVYDIEVDECHEYYANGILVHNCIDAARYAVMHLTFGR